MGRIIAFLTVCLFSYCSFAAAEELDRTFDGELDTPYKESVVRLNDYMSKNWNKKPDYFSDGITYTAEVDEKIAVFKVRRYNADIQHIDPFLIIKISKQPESHAHITTWEGDIGQDTRLNLSGTVQSIFKAKKCNRSCPLT